MQAYSKAIFHGEADTLVPIDAAERLVAALGELGTFVEFFPVPEERDGLAIKDIP